MLSSPTSVDDAIAELDKLQLPDLRARWLHLHRQEAPLRMSRQLLIQAIAYRLQERSLGKLPRDIERSLDQHGRGSSHRPASMKFRPKAGTRFLREWQGRTHEVITADDGSYLYRGKGYKSLSHIAREITGTRWSGPAFFGLKKRSGANDQV